MRRRASKWSRCTTISRPAANGTTRIIKAMRRLRVIHGDVKDLAALERNMAGHDVVIHLASNPDIARAATEPDIDFREGTFLTQQILEAMRLHRTLASALRFRQRRVWRPRGSRSPGGFRPAGSGLHLRRKQAGWRSTDRILLRDVRDHGLRVSLRQRGGRAADPRSRLRFRAAPARSSRIACVSWATAGRANRTFTWTT